MNFTAIMFSRQPLHREIPGVVVLNSVQTVRGPEAMLDARLDVLQRVKTPWCFYLDDDDDLPGGYLDVLAACADTGAPLAYTNELVITGDAQRVARGQAYDQAQHLQRPMMVHHLALMRTRDAVLAARSLPRGRYWAEMLLFWQLAKGGAAWIDRVGYVWNRGDGLNTKPWTHESQMRSAIWCGKNRS